MHLKSNSELHQLNGQTLLSTYLPRNIDRQQTKTHQVHKEHYREGRWSEIHPVSTNQSTEPSSITTKLYIYKSYIKPIFTYASPAWTENLSNPFGTNLKEPQPLHSDYTPLHFE